MAGFEDTGDRISAALIEKFYTIGVQGNEEDCIDVGCAVAVPGKEQHSSFIGGGEEPGEQQHSSIIGNDFVWNSNAVEFSPMFEISKAAEPGQCKADIDMQHNGSAHKGTATVGDYYEVAYCEQKLMKRCCCNRTHLNNYLHDVMYSYQKHSKLYEFMKTGVTNSDFDDSEDSYNKNSDACMNNVPDSFLSDLMNDDCMKLNPEEAAILNLLSSNAGVSDVFPFTSA